MLRFLLRRLLQTLLLLCFLSVLVFSLFSLIPGDYLVEMEMNPAIPAQLIDDLRRSYGLNEPIPLQYAKWLGRTLTGDLGYSFAQQRPAVVLIAERLTGTLALALGALLMAVPASLLLGILSAVRKGSWVDRTAMAISLACLSVPTLLMALLLLYAAFWTGWFPVGGKGGLSHLVLPCLTLAIPLVVLFGRTLRLEMIEILGQPFVRASRARGFPESRILWHALRNAANPLISMLGLALGGLLGGSVVVETVFGWPGLGSLTVDSILQRDLYVALGCVLTASVLTVLSNLLADLLLAWNDPRVRQQ